MRNISLIVGLLLVAAVALPATAQDSIRFSHPILVDSGSLPQWSPDGSMLAYLARGGLYVADTPQFKNPRRIGDAPRWSFQWVGNFGFAWVERPQPKHDTLQWNVAKLYMMDLAGGVQMVAADSVNYRQRQLPRIGKLLPSNDGTLGYYQIPGKDALQGIPRVIRRFAGPDYSRAAAPSRKFAYIDKPAGYPGPDGDIWIANPDGTEPRRITSGPNTWMSPVLAPNGLFVAADNHRGEIVILDSTGAVVANAGRGAFPSWCPDSRFLVFNVDQETEFEIAGAELYLFDLESGQRVQVTSTPHIIEGYPVWSPASMYIVYSTLDTNRVFIVRMEVAR